MFDRTRQIRFRKRKKTKGWVFIIILALVLLGLKFLWFKPAGPALTQNRTAVSPTQTAIATEALGPEEPLPIAEVSVRPILEKTLGLWGQALASGDYSQFHRLLSAGWRAQDDPKKLAQSYQSLYPYRDLMESFPRRGKLVVLESRPLNATANATRAIRDTLGPESPWLVRGEWRAGRSALGFNLNLVFEDQQWRPAGLMVEVYRTNIKP